jgi:uncharacterized protein (TIGR00255 family)
MSDTIVSMTGFGRASASLGPRTVSVEIRSLNHRGLDVKVRAHELCLAPEIEAEMLRMVRARLVRGSVAINVSEASGDGEAAGVDIERARQMHKALDRLRRELGVAAPVDLATLAGFLGATRNGPMAELSAAYWPALAPALETALDGLLAMRAHEGAAVQADLAGRLANLRSLVDQIAGLATPAVDPARLAHEVALLAERLDVSEEIARLRAHFGHLGTLLTGQGKDAPGRRIDFLAQEIGRELNTLGGKIQDADISALVIDAKAELEKLREQAQNIE